MTDSKKSYYAVIPANVRYDESLPPNAKLLYGELTALCNSDGYCWASNKYFADLYDVTTITVSRWLNSLVKRGYITSQIVYKEGTKEIDKRYIQICYDPINKNDNTPINEIVKDNNTSSFNNTNEYIDNMSDKPYAEIINYLNEKANTGYKPNTKATVKHINARLAEGYTVEDFKTVIDKKCAEWKGTEMEQYLRPETLFGTKFEGYLNAKISKKGGGASEKAVGNTNDDKFANWQPSGGIIL